MSSVKQNIFDYATSELSTSAFYAWLIAKLDPSASASKELKEVALAFVNECRLLSRLQSLELGSIVNISELRTEKKLNKNNKIDLFVKFELNDSTEKSFLLFIENKIDALETKHNQLVSYSKAIEEQYTDGEKAFIYLKSGYDFNDPLRNKVSGKLESKGMFVLLGWEKLNSIFQGYSKANSDLLQNYSQQVIAKHASYTRKTNASLIADFQLSQHIGQFCFFRRLFSDFFSSKQVEYTDKSTYYFTTDGSVSIELITNNNGGGAWSLFRPTNSWQNFGWQLHKLKKGYCLRAGVNTGHGVAEVNIKNNQEKAVKQFALFQDVIQNSPEALKYMDTLKISEYAKQTFFCTINLPETMDISDLTILNSITLSYLEACKTAGLCK